METIIHYLDVQIEFEPRRVSIGFDKATQAAAYYEAIRRTKFSQDMDLDVRLRGDYVSLRLPSRVTTIVASTSALGFYIVFSDEDLAKRWKDNLILWRYIANSRRKLFVRRDLSKAEINGLLGLPMEEVVSALPSSRDRSPGRAKFSEVRTH